MNTDKTTFHAGELTASCSKWVVTDTHQHPSLQPNDIVVMVVTPGLQNYFLRLHDMTLHSISGLWDQYVHVRQFGRL